MLLQLITQQPQVVGTILKNTPVWVWGLLAGLSWLGLLGQAPPAQPGQQAPDPDRRVLEDGAH
ncbi:MAG: hypothetical protein EOO25_22150, partial [Comamonadaceae bacterium]